ncbi:uncharacterized protein (UPF0303 family) [Pseudorhizobium tarimense]|uniref:UPF0303 protein ABID21_001109 n=1 Tax=Pseudorhizobium tarimense TaxID=1079109 RepID=A0ABV2H3A4_9HYPH|nr:heme-degrading domain-containing protein [Pseudorhizobium tarimense]MCJ8518011.1 heme-degrading domain-containing protein [Pseudorhizobium tarimense]
MTIEQDLARISQQEQTLRFDEFDPATAWELGAVLREMAIGRQASVVVDVHLHAMPAFYCALPGTTADNAAWVRRKRAVTLRFFQASYGMGLKLSQQNTTMEEKFGLPHADFATHGGSFPIFVTGTGCIGAVTVSGLPQREDHNMVVEALCRMLGKDHDSLKLS